MDVEQLRRYERINVIGTAGSGKSTFARALAELLRLPYYEMDQLFWKPNWQESSDVELCQKVRDITAQERWVLDGNYTRTIPEKWRRVQLVVWLDLSFLRTVLRVTRRAVRRSFTQQELLPGTGNRESLAKAFLSNDSIIWWAITSYRPNRRKYNAAMTAPEHLYIQFLHLRSPRMVESCLEDLRRAVEQPRPRS